MAVVTEEPPATHADAPPPRPRRRISLRHAIGEIGRLLILAGIMILLFVAYQLWGTGIAEARAQDKLADEFAALLAQEQSDPAPPTADATTPTTEPDLRPPPPEGDAVAHIVIPDIGVDKVVVEGVGITDLRKGPGHYPLTPLPGQPGNASLAGHRTTYGAPFNRIDELDVGDEIYVTTRQGSFTYQVIDQTIVSPSQGEVIEDFGDNRLTLTTCHPKYSARKRLVVFAELVGDPAPDDVDELAVPVDPDDPDGLDTLADPDPSTVDGSAGDDVDAADMPRRSLDDANTIHLPGDPAERIPSLLLGLLSLAVVVGARSLGRRWRRLPVFLLALPVWLAVVWVFFQHLSRALPQGV